MMIITIIFLVALAFFLLVLGFTMIFRVTDIHIGIPSSFFSGRIKKEKENGNSVPIREPYTEGLHIKFPWWTIEEISREVKAEPIVKRAFPVGEGGTVSISGIIQYRISSATAYRYQEVSAEGIQDGLRSELEQVIRTALMDENVDSAIIKTGEISNDLWKKLTATDLRTAEEIAIDPMGTPKERIVSGKIITYAEHAYGIEILKAKIDTIDPDEGLKESRDAKQKEQYEKASQSTEWDHLLEKATLLKQRFPEISDKDAWEAVQIWQEQTTQTIQKIKIDGGDALTGILASVLAGKTGGKE